MTPKWYVLQVKAGTEIDVAAELQRRGYWAVVPVEQRLIRRRRKWEQKPYVVFVGYVFLYIDYSWAKYYAITGVKGVIKILGGGQNPVFLYDEESEFMLNLTELLMAPSIIQFNDDDTYTVINGFLLKVKDSIIQIDRHAKRATVKVMIGGVEKTIKVSINIQKQMPEQTED